MPTIAGTPKDFGRTRNATTRTARCDRRERVRHVAHFVSLTQPDRASEIVLNDSEMIAVIVDVGGQLGAVTPADDALLAQARRLPVHFQLQLIRFHESRRLGEPFAELAEEEEKPVSLGFVIAQRGIDRAYGAPFNRAARQGQRGIAVPILGGRACGEDQQQEGDGPTHRREI